MSAARVPATIFLLLAILEMAVAADAGKAGDADLRMIVTLRDGSRIKGTPLQQKAPFSSSLMSTDLPLANVRRIECGKDSGEIVLSFANGDRLRGKLGWEAVELDALFGKARIDLRHIVSIDVYARGAQYWPREGLWGYWPLDGNAEDASGQEHHGKIEGATVTDGIIGGAYAFDGAAGIDLGNPDFSAERYTVSGWMRTSRAATVEDWRVWIDKMDDSGGPFMLGTSDGREEYGGRGPHYLAWQGGQGVVCPEIARGLNLFDGAWHMCTATYEKGSQKIYVDGRQAGAFNYAGPLPANKTPVRIGGHHFGPYHHPWIGDVDEVFIYQRALSAAEVEALFSRGQFSDSAPKAEAPPAR